MSSAFPYHYLIRCHLHSQSMVPSQASRRVSSTHPHRWRPACKRGKPKRQIENQQPTRTAHYVFGPMLTAVLSCMCVCLGLWASSAIEGYKCPRCRHSTTAWSSPSFLSFPNHLLLVMRRFLFDSWVPTKLDAPVNCALELQLDQYKGAGLQPGEDELPVEGGAGTGASAPVPDAGIVSQLEGMGFSANAASRAALAVNNSDGEAAMNWLLAHMEDANINDPPVLPAASATPTSSSNGPAPPADLVEQLASMGFDQARCVYALQQTSNSLDRAVEWLFSHADEPLPSSSSSSSNSSSSSSNSASAAANSDSGSSKYRLYAAITHLGKSTSTGHYVCHLRGEDGKWVLFNDEKVSEVEADEDGVGKGMDRAYMLLYQRVE